MLIINADDWGMNTLSTERISSCFERGRITSCSAMVFMEDSIRSAENAVGQGMDVGLHLNLSVPFTDTKVSREIHERQLAIRSFLDRSKVSWIFYNPLLKRHFRYIFEAQYGEFLRLYGREPSHINGHQHMHLCPNILLDELIPPGSTIRRNFTFARGEKDPFNRLCRSVMDRWLAKKYIIADYFFDLWPFENRGRIERIMRLSAEHNVELMVHPERSDQYKFLTDYEFERLISREQLGNYSRLGHAN